jgi:large subunit ribosomal protein L19
VRRKKFDSWQKSNSWATLPGRRHTSFPQNAHEFGRLAGSVLECKSYAQGGYNTVKQLCPVWVGLAVEGSVDSMTNALMLSLQPERNPELPELRAGDTVRVHQRIVEGRNERIQVFQGVVIAMHGGTSPGATYTVRRTAAHGIGVERTFPVYSKTVEKVEVLRNAKVRRAQLYYLRSRQGKAARLREKRFLGA